MEKRRLTSLRSVLLQYLVRTALACLLVAVGWLLVVLLWIQNSGLFLPANQAAQACQKAAQDVLPGMTAATFDETQLDSLCRYALFAAPDTGHVHNAVGGRPVAWRYELAEDRHVVGVENTETDTETESAAYNHGETVAES